MSKKLIINAKGVGDSTETNTAVFETLSHGLLNSITLQANGIAFDDAIKNINDYIANNLNNNISIGIYLNITSGKSLCEDLELLCDENSDFNNNFYGLLLKTLNSNNELLLRDLEREFRKQIETVLSRVPITHIDSNDYVHSIPKIFHLVCKLASEYNIPNVVTHFESSYILPDIFKYLKTKFLPGLIKKYLLNFFSTLNEDLVIKYGLNTNDFYISTLFESNMDLINILYATKSVKYDNMTVELSLHPRRYEEGLVNNYFNEYLLLRNKTLKNELIKLGYELAGYVK